METKFVEKMLKKDLIKQGQELEKENIVLREKNRTLTDNNKNLQEGFEKISQANADLTNERENLNEKIKSLSTVLELERGRSAGLRSKTTKQAKEITDLNIKVKTLEGTVAEITSDWATDNQSAEKQIEILKAELTSANKICGNKANLIETLKQENVMLTKSVCIRNIINFILGVCVIVLFGYICCTM